MKLSIKLAFLLAAFSFSITAFSNEAEDTQKDVLPEITNFHYISSSDDTVSATSETANIIYDYDSGLIVDFYCPYDGYDCAIRDQNPKKFQSKKNNLIQPYQEPADIVTKQNSLRERINQIKQLEEDESERASNSKSVLRTSLLPGAAYIRIWYDLLK